MRRIFIVLGIVLAVLAAAGVFVFLQFSRPSLIDVPVAVNEIPAGTILRPAMFRVAHMANIDPQISANWVTVSDWSTAEGKVALADIQAGFPLAKNQINPNTPSDLEMRLSVVLTQPNDYYVVIPTKPDEVGNFLQPGDRVDLIVSLGDIQRKDTLATEPLTPTTGSDNGTGAFPAGASSTISETGFPVSKLVMQNMLVLRVERDTTRQQSNASQQTSQTTEPQPVNVDNITRFYAKVTRDQLEVLSFVLNNGKHNIAVRAYTGSQESLPTDGVTWDDFARWFFAQHGSGSDQAQPFNTISPSTRANTAK